VIASSRAPAISAVPTMTTIIPPGVLWANACS